MYFARRANDRVVGEGKEGIGVHETVFLDQMAHVDERDHVVSSARDQQLALAHAQAEFESVVGVRLQLVHLW